MANKSAFDFNFKRTSSSDDYQKILIHQNHAIIRLLSMQTASTAQTVFNNLVIDDYAKNISELVKVTGQTTAEKKDDANSFW